MKILINTKKNFLNKVHTNLFIPLFVASSSPSISMDYTTQNDESIFMTITEKNKKLNIFIIFLK